MKKPQGSLISYFSNLVKEQGGINLAQGVPGFDPPQELLEILRRLIDEGNSIHQYAPGNGDYKLLEMIAKFYSSTAAFSPANVLIVQGATEALALTCMYVAKHVPQHSRVLSFDPPYESYPKLAEYNGLEFTYFPVDSSGDVDFGQLNKTVKEQQVRAIVLASPGNPMGKIWKKSELEQINRISLEHNTYILFDAVYKDIYYSNPVFNPLEFENPLLVYIDSFSKMLSITGWRIGYVIGEEKMIHEMRAIHDYTGLCAPHLFQRAIGDYLSQNNFGRDYTRILRKKSSENARFMKARLVRAGFTCMEPDGGYFLWAQVPAPYADGFEFASALYEATGVAVVPGENFSPDKCEYVRLNITLDRPILEKAAALILAFLKT